MRKFWLVALIAACGGTDKQAQDPNALGPCGAWPALGSAGASGYQCEYACYSQPPHYADTSAYMPCAHSTHDGSASGNGCERTFEFDGQQGCCLESLASGKPEIWFYSCD